MASGSLTIQEGGDRLDTAARINRQPGAERRARIERALARKNLSRHKIFQHRDGGEFLPFVEDIGLNRERHEDRRHGLVRIARKLLEYGEKLAELHHLVHVKKTLLDRPD